MIEPVKFRVRNDDIADHPRQLDPGEAGIDCLAIPLGGCPLRQEPFEQAVRRSQLMPDSGCPQRNDVRDVMHLADWLIDLGPGGGPLGGEIVYAGPREGIEKEPRSLTGRALLSWRAARPQ